jgi:hypothetical protein
MLKFREFYFRIPRTARASHRSIPHIGCDRESRRIQHAMKKHAMKTLLLGVVAAAAILGAAPASAEYREVRIVRDWDPPWHHPPW